MTSAAGKGWAPRSAAMGVKEEAQSVNAATFGEAAQRHCEGKL